MANLRLAFSQANM